MKVPGHSILCYQNLKLLQKRRTLRKNCQWSLKTRFCSFHTKYNSRQALIKGESPNTINRTTEKLIFYFKNRKRCSSVVVFVHLKFTHFGFFVLLKLN